MASTEGDRPEEENPSNNNNNNNNDNSNYNDVNLRMQSNITQEDSGRTSGRIIFGPPRPSVVNRIRMDDIHTNSPMTNNDGRSAATTNTNNNNNNLHDDDSSRVIPGTSIPVTMRINVNSSSNGNHNHPASAASAAFAALQHPHVQAAMARHASRSRTVDEPTADNAAGRPQSTTTPHNTTLRYNSPPPQQITFVPALSSSSVPTAPLPPLQPQPLPFSNSIDAMEIKLANNVACSKFSNTINLKAFLKRIECRICFGKFCNYIYIIRIS